MPQLPSFINRADPPRSIHNARVVSPRVRRNTLRIRWSLYGFVAGFSLAVLVR